MKLPSLESNMHRVRTIRQGLLAASLAAIVGGWCLSALSLAIIGAILYVVSSIMDYVAVICVFSHFLEDLNLGAREVKKYRSKNADRLQGFIFLMGLGGALYGAECEAEAGTLFAVPGAIIWFTEFLMWSAHGVISEQYLGVRLTKTYYDDWRYAGRCKGR